MLRYRQVRRPCLTGHRPRIIQTSLRSRANRIMNNKSAYVLLALFLVVYTVPLGFLCGSFWFNVPVENTRDVADAYSGGMQVSVNGLLILFLTLSSSRRQPSDLFWSGGTVAVCVVLTVISVTSLILAATIKGAAGRLTVEIGPLGMDRLYSTALRYSTETISYAALILGVRYQVERPPPSNN
jgi:hypothetical protein